jgi:hypothetical protein
MDTISAYFKGVTSRGQQLMVFDWNKAARIIRERNIQSASAGLSGDWFYTGGQILENGKPVPADETYTYLASTWATPGLEIDGDIIDCFIMKCDVPQEWLNNWDYEKVYWPESALKILADRPPGDGGEGSD